MKKCNYKNSDAGSYFHELMSSKKSLSFKTHLKSCKKCSGQLRKIKKLETLLELDKINQEKVELSLLKVPDINKILKEESIGTFSWVTNVVSGFSQISRQFAMQLAMKLTALVQQTSFAYSLALIIVVTVTIIGFKDNNSPNEKSTSIAKTDEVVVPAIASSVKSTDENKNWSFQAAGAVRESPLFSKSKIYFGSDDHKVYALSAKTGKPQWTFTTKGRISATPVVIKEKLLVPSTDEYLYVLNKNNGSLIWKRKIGKLVMSSLLIEEKGIHWVNNSGKACSISLENELNWCKELNVPVFSGPLQSKGEMIFGATDGYAYALSLKDGSISWKVKAGTYYLGSSPVEMGDLVIMGDNLGLVSAIDRTTKDINWEFKTSAPIICDITKLNNKIYFASDKMYCLSDTGTLLWDYETDSGIDVDFQIKGNIVSLVDKYNTFYTLHGDTGLCLNKKLNKQPLLSFALGANGTVYAGDKGKITYKKLKKKIN